MGETLVIGAGIAGLTAAHRLAACPNGQAGRSVRVIEANDYPGGRMSSFRDGDYVIDRGAQFIASGYRAMNKLMRETGLYADVVKVLRTDNAILRNGRWHAGDYDNPLVFLRSGLLSWQTKIKLLHIAGEMRRYWRKIHPLDPAKTVQSPLASELDRLTMPDYLGKTVSDEACEFLIGPALSATFDTDPENMSAAFLLSTLKFVMGGFDLRYIRGGIGRLPQVLADGLKVDYGTRALAAERDGKLWNVHVLRSDGKTETLTAETLIMATPGDRPAEIIAGLSENERTFFDAVRYCTGMVVFLKLDKPPATMPYYGAAFPRPERIGLYGMALDHFKPSACPEGKGLVNVALTETAAAMLWDAEDESVVRYTLAELARTPVGELSPTGFHIMRWKPMLPQFYAGYMHHIAAFQSRSNPTPNLFFAGDYLIGPYTEAALLSGERAAAKVLGH